MKTKLVLLFVALCLSVLAFWATPPLMADCSGDACGCWTAEAVCQAACAPTDDACMLRCTIRANHCSVCCCCDRCPTYCQ
jgi:hypothetical protein